jgi:hypothetical protein
LGDFVHSKMYILILTKNDGATHNLGDFFTNSYGHPGGNTRRTNDTSLKKCRSKTGHQFLQRWPDESVGAATHVYLLSVRLVAGSDKGQTASLNSGQTDGRFFTAARHGAIGIATASRTDDPGSIPDMAQDWFWTVAMHWRCKHVRNGSGHFIFSGFFHSMYLNGCRLQVCTWSIILRSTLTYI